MTSDFDLSLEMTCNACPEQYNVFYGLEKVGYIRLRHGHLSVSCPDSKGEVVFASIEPLGDGMFAESERDYFLSVCKHEIKEWMNKQSKYRNE